MSSRKKKKRKSSRKPVQAPPKKRFPVIWVSSIIGVAVGAAILVMINLRSNGQDQASKSNALVPEAQSNAALDKDQGFENLIGRWLRPDGGYIIEIRSIRTDGRMDAAYLNPRPINVARAEASWKNGNQEVFIELQDTGYPGSTYTLDYNPAQDVFTGVYFQAAMEQAFEVVFVRQN
jgi:hypothetical protein